jgi:hypothetical protein
MTAAAPAYPFGLEVDPPASQNRLTVFFRPFMVIPHAIILAVLGIVAQVLAVVAWLVIVITGRLPGGLASFLVNFYHWWVRVQGYGLLLAGRYPPFAMGPVADYPIRFAGEARLDGRSRLTVFFRIFMVIPHAIVLYFLQLVAQILVFIGWFAALFTGRLPGFIHDFVSGYLRWVSRVGAYMLLLTDDYPPFSMS